MVDAVAVAVGNGAFVFVLDLHQLPCAESERRISKSRVRGSDVHVCTLYVHLCTYVFLHYIM